METLLTNVNWIAIVVGAIAAYALGAFWFSPKLFGTKWMQGVGLTQEDAAQGPVTHAMITQGVGTFLLAWVIGITAALKSLHFALLVALTIAVLIKANGLFAHKSMYAIKVEAGFVLAMVVLMVAAHVVL